MKRIISTCLFLCCSLIGHGQISIPASHDVLKNSLQLNLAGDASLLSFHYDRLFEVSEGFMLSTKFGVGINQEFRICFGGCSGATELYTTFPHHLTAILGGGRHTVELGFGGTYLSGNTTEPYFLYPTLGYRLLPLGNMQSTFRAFVQFPVNGFQTEDILFIPVGISFGFGF